MRPYLSQLRLYSIDRGQERNKQRGGTDAKVSNQIDAIVDRYNASLRKSLIKVW